MDLADEEVMDDAEFKSRLLEIPEECQVKVLNLKNDQPQSYRTKSQLVNLIHEVYQAYSASKEPPPGGGTLPVCMEGQELKSEALCPFGAHRLRKGKSRERSMMEVKKTAVKMPEHLAKKKRGLGDMS